jgi:hypothetical protein
LGTKTYSELALGGAGECVVRRDDGRVLCWLPGTIEGDANQQPFTKTAREVVVARGVHGLSIGAEACGITKTGGVLCWTFPSNFGAGGAPTARTLAITNASALSIGARHACAVADRRIICWGDNRYGGLGDGTKDPHDAPVVVAGITGATAVTVSEYATCAATEGGKVYCWGYGDWPLSPQEVPELGGARRLVIGGGASLVRFTCGQRADGSISCMGSNAGVAALCKANQDICALHAAGYPECPIPTCPDWVDPSKVPNVRWDFAFASPPRGMWAKNYGFALWLGAGENGRQSFYVAGENGPCKQQGPFQALTFDLDPSGGRYCQIAPAPTQRDGQLVFEGEHVTCPGMSIVRGAPPPACGVPPEILLPP